jgi:hypothetical protein
VEEEDLNLVHAYVMAMELVLVDQVVVHGSIRIALVLNASWPVRESIFKN